jgi:hypothetical protein
MEEKTKKRLLYSIPILIGVYLIYRQFAGKKVVSSEVDEVAKVIETPIEKITKKLKDVVVGNDNFPLKNGSRGRRVTDLQKKINLYSFGGNKLAEDGIFGPKTEAAVQYWMGKNTIDNDTDLSDLTTRLLNGWSYSSRPSLTYPNFNF